MIAKQPSRTSARRLADAIQKLRRRAQPGGFSPLPDRDAAQWDCREDCSRPDAPPDLPTTHGLMLAAIEGRLSKLEQQVTNQNRILLIGIIAVVGDIVRQMLKP